MAVKEIKKVAVLGAGVMGATIAAHLANVGLPVYLLDIVPRELTPDEEKKGLDLKSPQVRNRLAIAGKAGLLKQRPDPLYRKSNVELITPGNFEDDMAKLKECDWIIEVIVENMGIKKKVFKDVEANWTPGTIVSSNTSGLSINEMVSDCSAEFRKYFLGTHFFNPPRYMKLLELIPCKETLPEIMDYMYRFCEKTLGKGVVFAKDTPNFIANRIGTYAMVQTIKLMLENNMTIEQVDAITGPPMGHPKSASFRTMDMVGLDTFCHVARTCIEKSTDPVEKEEMQLPELLDKMVEQSLLGDKTKQGFYKKVRGKDGSEILTLDYKTMEYRPREKAKYDIFKKTKEAGLKNGLKILVESDCEAGKFAWAFKKKLWTYSANRIPEIADDIVNVDRAMSWGFNWELGPFASWDAVGLRESVERMKKEGEKIPALVEEMLANGIESFYKEDEDGTLLYYDITSKSYQPVPVSKEIINLPTLKKQNKLVKGNDDGSLIDLGDGVVCLEMHSPQQAISPLFTQFIFEAIEETEKNFAGMVISNQERNFCVGANVGLLLMAAQSGEWDMLEKSVKDFQDAMMAIKYSRIPVVGAPFQMTLGGGMEIVLHCDRIHAAAETYMGQVEMGVGLIPGGGGNKELLYRFIEGIPEGVDVDLLPFVQKAFEAIAMATVSTSAPHAQELGFMRKTDKISINQDFLIHDAKQTVLGMLTEGYEPPRTKAVPALGDYGIAAFKAGVQNLRWGNYISDHDMKIALEVAYVLCGGNIRPKTMVSEQYLLDIEREAFLRLIGEEKTQERIMSLLTTGKAVRN